MIWYKTKQPGEYAGYEDWVPVNFMFYTYNSRDFCIFDIKLEDVIYTEETTKFTAHLAKLKIWLKLL